MRRDCETRKWKCGKRENESWEGKKDENKVTRKWQVITVAQVFDGDGIITPRKVVQLSFNRAHVKGLTTIMPFSEADELPI